MASARANLASQSREAPRRPQRAPQRGPEVIVLTRRAPEATMGGDRVERPVSPTAEQSEPPRDAAHRRRRR
jgi:hypothetical protein